MFQDNPLTNVKRVNPALLPPSRSTLALKIKRAQYISIIWERSSDGFSTKDLDPRDYGWIQKDGCFVPLWISGSPVPEQVTTTVRLQYCKTFLTEIVHLQLTYLLHDTRI